MEKMDGDDVSKDSIEAVPHGPRGIDILIFDKQLVSKEKNITCYPVAKPIGFAVLMGSEKSPYHDTHSEAIRGDLDRMTNVMKDLEWTVLSPSRSNSSREVTFTLDQWDKLLENLKSKASDLKQYSCFLFYYSGHGISDSVILSDGELLEYRDIICEISEIPSLEYKPKIFIFDSCRERIDFDKCEKEEIRHENLNKDGNFEKHIREAHNESDGFPPTDTMICYSASEGTKGWMAKEKGSVFTIQFAHALRQFSSQLSLCEIVTQVIGGTVEIARRVLNRLQCPVFYSTMTRMLILNEHCQSLGFKNVMFRQSSHIAGELEPCNVGNNQPQDKGPYRTSWGASRENQDSDVCKDTVTSAGVKKVAKRSFTSRQEVEAHVSQLGEGVSVFIVYAPDPESPYFDPCTREAQINLNECLVFNLAYDLERHGFHVVTDLHLFDKEPSNWLQWYTSRISLCDFVILVCSPAFNQLFSHDLQSGHQIIDRRAQLLLHYKNTVYAEIMSEVQSKQNGGKFVPVMLHPYWSVEECVPTLFRAGAIYEVYKEEAPREFRYDDQRRGFEKLVCRMAGINRMELDKPQFVGVHQLEPHICEAGGEYDQRMLFEAAKKPKKGHKIIKLQPLYPGSRFQATAAPPPRDFCTHPPYPPCPQPVHVHSQQVPHSTSHIHHPPVQPPKLQPIATTTTPTPVYAPPHPPTAPLTAAATVDLNVLPDKEPSRIVLLWLSDRIVRWKFIGRFLALENHEIERIEAENPGDISEQCYRMLDKWREQRSSPYNYRTLGEQLLKSEANRELYPEYVKKVIETENTIN